MTLQLLWTPPPSLTPLPPLLSPLDNVQPHLSYREIMTTMVDANLHRTSREFLPEARRTLASMLTFLLPKGCLIRTAQVCFSRRFAEPRDRLCQGPSQMRCRSRRLDGFGVFRGVTALVYVLYTFLFSLVFLRADGKVWRESWSYRCLARFPWHWVAMFDPG